MISSPPKVIRVADSSIHSVPPILISRGMPANNAISSTLVNPNGDSNTVFTHQIATSVQPVQLTTISPAWQQRFVLELVVQ